MSRYDIKAELLQSVALGTQLINTDTTTAGVEIDMQGYNSLLFVMQAGVVTAGDATLLIQDSDTSGSGYADVTDTFLSGTEALTIVDATNEITRIGYVGKKRYVKCSVVTANSANLTVGVIALRGKGNVPQS